jgi:hypothetical protein
VAALFKHLKICLRFWTFSLMPALMSALCTDTTQFLSVHRIGITNDKPCEFVTHYSVHLMFSASDVCYLIWCMYENSTCSSTSTSHSSL